MKDLSQDPLTKYLVKFCEKGYHVLKQLKFNDVLTLATITEDFRKISTQACVCKTPICNPSTIDLGYKLSNMIQQVGESKCLIVIFQTLSVLIQYIELDIDFRKTSSHFQKDLLLPLLNIDAFMPFVVNKKYTDLIIEALYVDLSILHDGELYLAAVENFMKNLDLLFADLRKEKYKELSKKIQPLKGELVAAVMHPSRIEKMIDSGVSVEEIEAVYAV